MKKLDLKKTLKHLYTPSAKEVRVVEVPPMNFIMVDGEGDPNTTAAFQQITEVLYGLAYTLKFASKKMGIDYPVMALEGLWWMDNMGDKYGDVDFTADKSLWKYTLMIMQPDHITQMLFNEARDELRRKKNPVMLDQVRYERFDEGLCVQIMHIGPYSAEKPTIDRLHAYIADNGYQPGGKHHEIYVGDPRRSAPEKLRTVIRQPMAQA